MVIIKRCEECGAITEHRVENSTEGFFCTKCSWSLVTTVMPEIDANIIKYKIYLLFANAHNKDHVKALSEVANVNFLQAMKMVKKNRPLIFEGEALEVNKVIKILNKLSIEYEITPKFPYADSKNIEL